MSVWYDECCFMSVFFCNANLPKSNFISNFEKTWAPCIYFSKWCLRGIGNLISFRHLFNFLSLWLDISFLATVQSVCSSRMLDLPIVTLRVWSIQFAEGYWYLICTVLHHMAFLGVMLSDVAYSIHLYVRGKQSASLIPTTYSRHLHNMSGGVSLLL